MMNLRENHLAALRLQPCQRTPRWELGFWSGTIQRWYVEGLPGSEQALRAGESYGSWVSSGGIGVPLNSEAQREHDVSRFFGMDRGVSLHRHQLQHLSRLSRRGAGGDRRVHHPP